MLSPESYARSSDLAFRLNYENYVKFMNDEYAEFEFDNSAWEQDTYIASENRLKDIKSHHASIKHFLEEQGCTILREFAHGENTGSNGLHIQNRIGSESLFGQVFKTELKEGDNSFFLATKVMPITQLSDYTEHAKEIRIAIELSEHVLKGDTDKFPIIFGSKSCNNAVLYEQRGSKNRLAKSAKVYAICEKLALIALKQKLSEKGIPFEEQENKARLFQELNSLIIKFSVSLTGFFMVPINREPTLNYDNLQKIFMETTGKEFSSDILEITPKANVLFMELANQDAISFIKKHERFGVQQALSMLFQIFKGVNFMHKKAGYSHADLHLGNVLINFNLDSITHKMKTFCILNDFGKSQPSGIKEKGHNFLEKTTTISAIEKILYVFRDYTAPIKHMMDLLNRLPYTGETTETMFFLRKLEYIVEIEKKTANFLQMGNGLYFFAKTISEKIFNVLNDKLELDPYLGIINPKNLKLEYRTEISRLGKSVPAFDLEYINRKSVAQEILKEKRKRTRLSGTNTSSSNQKSTKRRNMNFNKSKNLEPPLLEDLRSKNLETYIYNPNESPIVPSSIPVDVSDNISYPNYSSSTEKLQRTEMLRRQRELEREDSIYNDGISEDESPYRLYSSFDIETSIVNDPSDPRLLKKIKNLLI